VRRSFAPPGHSACSSWCAARRRSARAEVRLAYQVDVLRPSAHARRRSSAAGERVPPCARRSPGAARCQLGLTGPRAISSAWRSRLTAPRAGRRQKNGSKRRSREPTPPVRPRPPDAGPHTRGAPPVAFVGLTSRLAADDRQARGAGRPRRAPVFAHGHLVRRARSDPPSRRAAGDSTPRVALRQRAHGDPVRAPRGWRRPRRAERELPPQLTSAGFVWLLRKLPPAVRRAVTRLASPGRS